MWYWFGCAAICRCCTCIRQAWYNQTHAYRGLRLHVVAGSLGIGLLHQGPFYEYGGAEYTTFAHYS